jgi:hypothetical protein
VVFEKHHKGDERGVREVFIVAARRRLRQALKELKRGGSNGGDSVTGKKSGPKWKMGLTGGSRSSALGEGKCQDTVSGWCIAGPRAESGAGLNGFPRPVFNFIFFSSFLFLIFLFAS